MMKYLKTGWLAGLCLLLTGCGGEQAKVKLWPILLLVLAVPMLALAALRTYSHIQYLKRQRRRNRRIVHKNLDPVTIGLYGLAAVMLLVSLVGFCLGSTKKPNEDPAETQEPIQPEETEAPSVFAPAAVADTDPDNWNIRWEIFQNNQLLHSYIREEPISFGEPEDYFALPGISAFRGNNYRNSASYGTADVTQQKLSKDWTVETGALAGGDQSGGPGASWTGSGWTGQPLIVKWDAQTRNIMNLYPDKKAKEDLVEVVYATLDGHIYFLDLEDGSATRDPVNIGMCFKGAGSLDPRGYPLLYVGAGDSSASGERPRMYIISLIDGSVLYETGNNEPLALRRDNDWWCGYDSSPLVHGDTDTLIWPGENGLLYTTKLNTHYEKAAGTISIDPDAAVLTRYNTGRSGENKYWYGYEASVSVVDNYLYVSENGGMFYCVDLNTMELVWAQDTADDSNVSPVVEKVAEDQVYLYTAPSLHWTRNDDMTGTIHLYKLDAITGEILWKTPYQVHTIESLSGGVQATAVLGKAGSTLEGLVIYAISRTPDPYTGILVALDTQTGAEVWRLEMDNYAWSSPVAVYDDAGKGYVILCDAGGNATLVEGATGKVLDKLQLGGLIEASPAVYEDTMVIGTRVCTIVGVDIS